MTRKRGNIQHKSFRIPYRICGEGEDILCLNGIQQSMAMWGSFIRRFEKQYRITLFDFPYQGNGKTNNGSPKLSLDEQVAILESVMCQIGIEKATICSASWGGVIALLFAISFPHRIERLLLASVGMRPNALMKDTILTGIKGEKSNREHMAQIIINRFGGNLPARIKRQITNQFKIMPHERLAAFCEHGLAVIAAGSLNKIVPLSRISNSTVIIYGENDKIIDYADVEELALQIPDCTIKIIPDAGHFLHLENEKVFDVYEEIFTRKICVLPK